MTILDKTDLSNHFKIPKGDNNLLSVYEKKKKVKRFLENNIVYNSINNWYSFLCYAKFLYRSFEKFLLQKTLNFFFRNNGDSWINEVSIRSHSKKKFFELDLPFIEIFLFSHFSFIITRKRESICFSFSYKFSLRNFFKSAC